LVSYGSKDDNIISIGAEAILLLDEWFGLPAVRKIRVRKKYRETTLDELIRRKRTLIEARLLIAAHEKGVPTPIVYDIDKDHYSILMEYIPGTKLRDIVESLPVKLMEKIFFEIGYHSGILHENEICHGDLTTSNVLFVREREAIFFIDFGLGAFTNRLEDAGVDVHLFLRSLESAHTSVTKQAFKAFINGYRRARSQKTVKMVLDKVEEIRSRGRYTSR